VVLEVCVDEGRVSIAVSDDGPGLEGLPVDTLPPLDAEGSRGLFLVRKLSSGLQLDEESIGTTVRCWLPEAPAVPGQERRDGAR
jgi:anti-sigma regulatory factor (Ser/Thr protein kinase)